MADDDGRGSFASHPTLPARGDDEELPAGLLVGDWEIERRTNRGGFASIYRAGDAAGRVAAIKLLHASLVHSPRILTRFQREAQTIGDLRHPNIVEIFGVGLIPDGRPWIAMEWLDGHDLSQEIKRRGALPLDEVLALLRPLCSALAAAHAQGVVHRDIKPQNVMLVARDDGFAVKLVDFGIAKLGEDVAGADGLTRTGEIVGTPLNMAPEQILNGTVDARTDVYALGLLLYNLITGRPAFNGESASELQEQHLHAPAPKASERAAVGPAVDAVIARCLEKPAAARYPDVGAFFDDLARAARAGGAPVDVPSLGLYLEARVGEDVSDEILDEVEAALDLARERARGAGMSLVADGGTALLAVQSLPPSEGDAAARRRATIGWARELLVDVAPRFDLVAVLHAAPRAALLRASEWTLGRPPSGLAATRAFIDGLDLPVEPAGEQLVWLR